MRRKIKNFVLKTITAIAAADVIFFGCCLDSESTFPAKAVAVGLVWLILYCKANNWFSQEVYYGR